MMKYFYKDKDGMVFVKNEYQRPGYNNDLDLLKIEDFADLFAEINSDELGVKEIYWDYRLISYPVSLYLSCAINPEDTIFLINMLKLDTEQIQTLFEEILKSPKTNNASMSTLFTIMSLYGELPDDLKLLIEAKK